MEGEGALVCLGCSEVELERETGKQKRHNWTAKQKDRQANGDRQREGRAREAEREEGGGER